MLLSEASPSARVPKSSAPVCSAPPAFGSHPLKQSSQQPSSWRLLGACCIPALQADRYFLRPKLAPSLCFLLRSKCVLHRLHGPNVYPFSSGRIRIASKTYTFGGENVYVSSVKRIRLGYETYTFCPHKVYVLPAQPPPAPHERPAVPPFAPALYRPLPYHFCRGAEEVCRRKSLPSWCFPGWEVSFIRSVQRTATSRPQPIRIQGKVREADSLPDTRGRIVSSKN